MFSIMAVVRRLFSFLVAVALLVGTVTATVHASSMTGEMAAYGITAGEMSAGMGEPRPDRCPDCEDKAVMMSCMQTLCATFSAILPRDGIVIADAVAEFSAPRSETGAGLARLPDPKPPQTTFIG
jgi:hypothetical protein